MSTKNNLKYCSKCKKKDTCAEMCAPVEALLSQVTTRPEHQGKLPQDYTLRFKNVKTWPTPKESKEQLIIDLYFIDGRKQSEIVLIVGCAKSYVSKTVKSYKEKINSKVRRGRPPKITKSSPK